jgi:hypothetical protein
MAILMLNEMKTVKNKNAFKKIIPENSFDKEMSCLMIIRDLLPEPKRHG